MKSPSKEVVSIAPIIQLTVFDCVVACVAMLTGHPYSDVFQGAPRTAKIVRKQGSLEREMRKLAAGVGCKLIRSRSYDLDEDTGILFLEATDKDKLSHAVVLFRGTIIDPSTGLLWDPAVYLQTHPHLAASDLFLLS